MGAENGREGGGRYVCSGRRRRICRARILFHAPSNLRHVRPLDMGDDTHIWSLDESDIEATAAPDRPRLARSSSERTPRRSQTFSTPSTPMPAQAAIPAATSAPPAHAHTSEQEPQGRRSTFSFNRLSRSLRLKNGKKEASSPASVHSSAADTPSQHRKPFFLRMIPNFSKKKSFDLEPLDVHIVPVASFAPPSPAKADYFKSKKVCNKRIHHTAPHSSCRESICGSLDTGRTKLR